MRRLLLGMAGVVLALAPGFGAVAQADDSELTISHVQPAGDEVNILVSVPEGTETDLDGITVTIGNVSAESRAEQAGEDTSEQVRRTTILAMDTSDSMEGARFAAAKAAAEQFLEDVPADVYVGIVTFDGRVVTRLSPTLDRGAASEVIEDLVLARGTLLNDGVIGAVSLAGDEGQRSVLVLSDGRNSNETPLSAVETAVSEAGVKVDAVALDQAGPGLAPLRTMAEAGGGSVISSDPAALTAAFTAEADSLARQILITATLPAEVVDEEANVVVTVPDGSATLTARAFSVVRGDAEAPTPEAPRAETEETLQIPESVMYGGIAAIGIGMLFVFGSIMMMATAGSQPKSVEQRIAAFGSSAPAPGTRKAEATPTFNLEQAKDAAATMLRHNRGLEARIEHRLEAAGSALRAAEWLLMHGFIVILAGLVALLLGGGNPLLVVLGLALGLVVPWLYLGRRRKKRVNAFNTGLADTLQLISGSLSAGMSLAQSIDSVVAEGNEPIAGEFKRVLVETRLGVPLELALEGIAARIESKDFAWVVMAIRIQREVGGNLSELLNTVAETLREREYLRRQVKSLSAEGRISAYILVALPILMLGYMSTFRPEFVKPMFTEPMGVLMLLAAGTLLGLGWLMMSRIVKVEV